MQVTLIFAQTIDGYIARTEHDRSFDWTSPEDKAFYISHLRESDTVIMGSKTMDTFERFPRGKHFVVLTRKPNEYQNPKPDIIRVTPTNDSPQEICRMLAAQGAEKVLVAGGASVYRQFLAAGVVDRVFITIEPILFGGGIKCIDKPLLDTGLFSLFLQKVHQISADSVVMEYATKKA